MPHFTRAPLWSQVESLARQFAQAPGLPFADVLCSQRVQTAFAVEGVAAIDCVYTPLATVRLLLAQALDPDPSLRQAVSRLVAERAAARLVPQPLLIFGYSRFSLVRASSILNCQSTPRCLAFVLSAQIPISDCSNGSSLMRRLRRH